jgi:hypothetical protein
MDVSGAFFANPLIPPDRQMLAHDRGQGQEQSGMSNSLDTPQPV